jgi:hypothetical protein
VCDHSHTLFPLGRESVYGQGRDVVMAIPFSASERKGRLDHKLALPSSFLESEKGHQLYSLLLLMKGCVRIHSVEEAVVCDHSNTLFLLEGGCLWKGKGCGHEPRPELGLGLAWVWPGLHLGCTWAVPGPGRLCLAWAWAAVLGHPESKHDDCYSLRSTQKANMRAPRRQT